MKAKILGIKSVDYVSKKRVGLFRVQNCTLSASLVVVRLRTLSGRLSALCSSV